MKAKTLIKITFLLIGLLLCVTVLNLPVTTRQGINYSVHTIKIPLYIKILEFIDRNYSYRVLVKDIIRDCKDEQEKVMKIFRWTYKNIRKAPVDFPIVDDHVWHIIVRGYGVNDQFSDVFATLCNYAGVDAFYTWAYSDDKKSALPLAFVEINDKWFVFYPYRGAYFENCRGELADIEDIKANDWVVVEDKGEKANLNYADYLSNLSIPKEYGLTRTNIQSPFNRLIFEIKKWIRK